MSSKYSSTKSKLSKNDKQVQNKPVKHLQSPTPTFDSNDSSSRITPQDISAEVLNSKLEDEENLDEEPDLDSKSRKKKPVDLNKIREQLGKNLRSQLHENSYKKPTAGKTPNKFYPPSSSLGLEIDEYRERQSADMLKLKQSSKTLESNKTSNKYNNKFFTYVKANPKLDLPLPYSEEPHSSTSFSRPGSPIPLSGTSLYRPSSTSSELRGIPEIDLATFSMLRSDSPKNV